MELMPWPVVIEWFRLGRRRLMTVSDDSETDKTDEPDDLGGLGMRATTRTDDSK